VANPLTSGTDRRGDLGCSFHRRRPVHNSAPPAADAIPGLSLGDRTCIALPPAWRTGRHGGPAWAEVGRIEIIRSALMKSEGEEVGCPLPRLTYHLWAYARMFTSWEICSIRPRAVPAKAGCYIG